MQEQFSFYNYDNFPIDALPENLRKTLFEVERMVRSPIGLIASSMFSTMAIACQGAVNVKTPIGEVFPLSLFMVTIAESGERKTSTDKIFTKPIRDFEARRRQERDKELKEFQSIKIVWDIHMQELQKLVRALIKTEEAVESTREDIENLLLNKPVAPLQMRLLYSDATIEALLNSLAHQWPSGAIHSSEGLSVLGGRTFQNLGPLSELWDGDNYIHVDRLNAESYELKDARLSISLMIQLQPFKDFLEKKNSLAINSGLISRFLIAMPTSTQGGRRVEKFDDNKNSNALQEFKSKITHWLEKSENRALKNEPYQEFTFETDAEYLYLSILTNIEDMIKPGGFYREHSAFASKIGNNLARLAALIHAFSFENETINTQSLKAARHLLSWYSDQHTNFIKIVRNELTADDMGNILYKWLTTHPPLEGSISYGVTNLYKKGPSQLRSKEKMQEAINNLENRKKIIHNRFHKPVDIVLLTTPNNPPFDIDKTHITSENIQNNIIPKQESVLKEIKFDKPIVGF